jgi:hypothetical protein
MRPLLIGRDNPYNGDALLPLPRGAAGDRLRRILGMTDREYLRAFERMNLDDVDGEWYSHDPEWVTASLLTQHPGPFILLGRDVCLALGIPYRPFRTAWIRGCFQALTLPHPSGRCRTWNDRKNWTRARRAVTRLRRGTMTEEAKES